MGGPLNVPTPDQPPAGAIDGSIDPRADRRRQQCLALLRERRIVGDHLGFQLCPNPSWDILLDLYLAELEDRTTYLWQSCVAANTPISSAHRKIGELIEQGLVERTGSFADKRRVGIRLSALGRMKFDRMMDRLVE